MMSFKLAAFADEADSRFSEQIKAMAENDIKYLEIRNVDGQSIAYLSKEKAVDIKKQLDDADISVWSLGSPYGKIKITDDFSAHLDRFKYGIELAEILQTRHIRMFSFYVPSGEEGYYKDEVFERLDRMLEAAEGSGIILCHENEKGIYGDMASRCEEIHKAFPKLRAVFDPANFIQCGQDTLGAWEKLSQYVEYMHVKDAFANGKVVPAGKGVGNIPYLLSKFSGEVLSIEPHLAVFKGLEELEAVEKTKMGYCYPSARIAFDAAVNALKELI